MAPMEGERKQEATQKGPLCCALPPLPILPRFPHLNKELEGCLCSITNLHSVLVKAFDSFKDNILFNICDAARKHPHLLRLLPPQIMSSCLPHHQIRDHGGKQHELAAYNFAAILPGDSVAAVVVSNGILNFLNIYNTLLVVRLILTWFPAPPQVIVNPLSTICDPYLNVFRGIIPPLGGTIDLSPILAFLVLNVFTNSAAALPAELPASQTAGTGPLLAAEIPLLDLTCSQKAWIKRLTASRKAREGMSQSSME